MQKCLIVAVADDLAIGKGQELPWHISADLKFFRKTTMGCPVVMGRKTYESIGRPLPGRKNIVVSRSCPQIDGVIVVSSLDAAFDAAEPAEKCFVIGGASIYAAAMDMVDEMYITHVHTTIPEADARFPEVDAEKWDVELLEEPHVDEETGLSFEFTLYRKR